MAVFEQTEGGFAPAFLSSLARALAGFALASMVAAPLVLGGMFGYLVTEQLDDPEGISFRANLPQVETDGRHGTAASGES
jgi:ABC-type nitrate/sulfonate/bicarbonate transport system permease component